MDLFTGLVLIQKDTQQLVLKQYRYGSLLDACAVAAGARPPQIATLYTGVLGRPVYSALKEENTQAGGQSPEDQRRTAEMLYSLLNKGGKFAEQGQILFDPNLSNSEKSQKWLTTAVNDAGGPIPFISQVLFGLSAAGGTVATGIYKFKKLYNESGESQLQNAIEGIEGQHSKKLFTDKQGPVEKIQAIAQAYEQNQALIEAMGPFVGDYRNEITPTELKTKIASLVNDLPNNPSEQNQKVMKWLNWSLESAANLVARKKIDPIKLNLDVEVQGKIGNIIRYFTAKADIPQHEPSDILVDYQISEQTPEELDKLKSELQKSVDQTSKGLLMAFRNESLILRYVLENLMK
jgi:hypothetical protein